MFYKLSNTSEMKHIEDAFGAKFKYPLLYNKAAIINGLKEQTIPIISMHSSDTINFAIWGLLPQHYKDDWESFQNITNTLNISINSLSESNWAGDLLPNQRCVIMVSGFFASFLFEGQVYPFYVHDKNNNPFALAGVYTTLDDGFLSVSLVTSSLKNSLKEVHNMDEEFPIALDEQHYKDWLNPNVNFTKYDVLDIPRLELKAHTISKEFYKNDIVFDSILEPAYYSKLPVLTLK